MSNRCGHNRDKLRLCDIVSRGKGGQPRVLGIISARLSKVATRRARLKSWDYHSDSRRFRRSESRESTIAVLQFLIANWFQLETRRCAMPGTDFLECPDVGYLARAISKSPDWRGSRLSVGRVYAALKSLVDAGYITRSKQKRQQLPNGSWISAPKITTFTRKFFLELGGKRLWRSVVHSGRLKLAKIRHRIKNTVMPGQDPRHALGEYLNPPDLVSPKRARFLNRIRPPGWSENRPHLPRQFKFQE